jgi:phosphoribosyl-dephospho-CoA transferase
MVVNAHDLLWGQLTLPADAPGWAVEALQNVHAPVVVRRAPAPAGYVAVGIRGRARAQRFGTLMALAAVQRRVTPEQLAQVDPGDHWPALHALAVLRKRLAGMAWGVAGSAGYELGSGLSALHAESDLDLILRASQRIDPSAAQRLLTLLAIPGCRIDLQLQTPLGGVTLAEWARQPRHVLLKTDLGPQLVRDPWSGQ